MVGANPERTSWTPEEVTGALRVEWYRPIEAYISQNVQIIASNGLIFISTARGLYALNPTTGDTVWRYDTELPLGNSPTVHNGILYVGGYDRKLHALNAVTGAYLWSFDGAEAGYDTNPLVIDNKIVLGNRDGHMYAIGAHGSPNQGQLLWKFKTDGPIHLSAAYNNGVVYFASNDNFAYALSANNGALLWKSAKLPGDGYHSYWPVIYQNMVVFSASVGYRSGIEPGTKSVLDESGNGYDTYNSMERTDIFYNKPLGDLLGPLLPSQDWSHGYPIVDASLITEYFEDNPIRDAHKHKPWRRSTIALNISDGSEYTFDSDNDGYREYIPFSYWGTKSGNRYPPVIGPDGILYQSNLYENIGDAQGKVMGWNIGTQYLSVVGGQGAIAEPQSLSMGGSLIYRNLCCDRLGSYFDINDDGFRPWSLWSYNLEGIAPAYDDMWIVFPGWPRLHGWYQGNTNSSNGIYHNHGDQNPIIPYNGRVYVHRSNTVFAFGTGAAQGKRPSLYIIAGQNTSTPWSYSTLQAMLEEEIEKMIVSGQLRPGYYNNGGFSNYREFTNYYENPGDTLYTLSMAYPHLSVGLQSDVRTYLQEHFSKFFNPVMYSRIGWADGAPREAMPLPPEVETSLSNFPPMESSTRFSWFYPQHNFYAMWKYALIVPGQASQIYSLAKSKLQVPVPSMADAEYFRFRPFELNAYIAGYFGFLELQEMAGATQTDAALRTTVTNELNRLLAMRVNNFEKDTPWGDDRYHKKVFNIAQNFLMLVPELGDHLHATILPEVQEALNEYDYIAPYWFVSRYESMINEGVMSPLYNSPALFQAKAYALKQNRDELSKYLDAPAFSVGDLFYIQNIVAALDAPP